MDQNYSDNYGHEGPADDPKIKAIRLRQIKNALVTLYISQGTPMMLSGDEVRRTQRGNNNAYCQDNEMSWFNWANVGKHADLLRFAQRLIRFNREHPVLNMEIYPANHSTTQLDNVPTLGPKSSLDEYVTYHGVKLDHPDRGYYSHSIALALNGGSTDDDMYIIFNAYWADLTFELPPRPPVSPWLCAIDTSQPSPRDIAEPGQERPVPGTTYLARARSTVVLIAHI
jgi:glycogen operon protein